MHFKAYERDIGLRLPRFCFRILATLFWCQFFMLITILGVQFVFSEQTAVDITYYLCGVFTIICLLIVRLLPSTMFDIQDQALLILGGLGGVRKKVALGDIKTLYIVGAAKVVFGRVTLTKRIGYHTKNHKRREKKFNYLPSLLIYEADEEPLYRGPDGLSYEGYTYSFVITRKNCEAFFDIVHNTKCTIYFDGSLINTEPILQLLYNENSVLPRLSPLPRDRASSIRQGRIL